VRRRLIGNPERLSPKVVIPAKAGIQEFQWDLDSGSPLRSGRNDDLGSWRNFLIILLELDPKVRSGCAGGARPAADDERLLLKLVS
jgi:hypothetical protein